MPSALPLIFLLLAPKAAPVDALSLLNEVSQRYADAKSYHIEAVEERTISNDFMRHWDKTTMTAVWMSEGRYRFEGQSGMGRVILVSDGTTQWGYHPDDKLYTKKSATGEPPKEPIITPEELAVHSARGLQRKLAHVADRIKDTKLVRNEEISVNGKKIKCYVIQYDDYYDSARQVGYDWTVWIDRSRKVIVKSVSRGETHTQTRAGIPIPRFSETVTVYPVVKLGEEEPASTFKFEPAAEAKLTEEFPDLVRRNASYGAEDMCGKPVPELQLKAADGSVTSLRGFHGKPVFVEFWATWCAPCTDLTSGLVKLHAETADKGLVWVGIDSDEDPSVAEAYIAREHLVWPNFHDLAGQYGQALRRTGIPLGVLIDADGKITFYKSGYSITELRAAIAKLGPEYASVTGEASAAPVKGPE